MWKKERIVGNGEGERDLYAPFKFYGSSLNDLIQESQETEILYLSTLECSLELKINVEEHCIILRSKLLLVYRFLKDFIRITNRIVKFKIYHLKKRVWLAGGGHQMKSSQCRL